MGFNSEFKGLTHFFIMTQQSPPPVGQGLLITEDSWSHSDTPQSVGLLWTSDRPVAKTSTWQHSRETSTPLAGFEPTIPVKSAAADPRLSPRGHWDRLTVNLLSFHSSQNLDPPVYKLLWYPSHQFLYKEEYPDLLECHTSLRKTSNTELFQLINVNNLCMNRLRM